MFKRFLLQMPDGDSGAGGLGGEGDAGGDAGNSGSDGGDSGSNGTPPASADVGPAWAKGWEGLDQDLLGDPSLKAIQNPAALLKSYVHSQKNMGKNKTIIPDKNSTQEERDQFYQKIGVPLEESKYAESVKYDKDKTVLGEDLSKEYVKLAHNLRILPDQAQKVYDFFNTQTASKAERIQQESAAKMQEELDGLQSKLGVEAYNVKLTKATNFLKENAPPEFMEFLGKTGLGKNAAVVSAFMQMADKFGSEENLPSGDNSSAMTIDDIERSINDMLGNSGGAYLNPSHPDHKRSVNEMLSLQTKLDKARTRA